MTEGYIAVVLPKLHEVDKLLSELMTEADYETLLNQNEESGVALDERHDDAIQGTDSHCDNVPG
jgi:hypothetical protein